MSYKLIVASAHKTGLPDKSVHVIVTSSPYYSLRAYSGNQAIEWPEVIYAPIAGMPEITIPGCEADCVHEWVDGPHRSYSGGTNHATVRNHIDSRTHFSGTRGAYCIHCGGWRGGLGSEPTIESFMGHLILVLREMWRVLRDDGICFFNLGDSYTGSGGAHAPHHNNEGLSKSARRNGVGHGHTAKPASIPAKNLMMVPARFALAAQADGWIVRSAMPWIKRNGLPDSAEDKPGCAIESVFMLVKQEKYYFDMFAVQQPASQPVGESQFTGQIKQMDLRGRNLAQSKLGTNQGAPMRNLRAADLFFRTWEGMLLDDCGDPMAMVINLKGYAGPHHAVFPPELPEMAILAGTSAAGVCPHCGKQWRRCVEKPQPPAEIRNRGNGSKMDFHTRQTGSGQKLQDWYDAHPATTTGWLPSCSCPAHDPIPAVVLDPFVGSGTTCMVAEWLGRDSIGLDLSDEYHALAHARINTPRERAEDKRAPADGQMGLFETFAL